MTFAARQHYSYASALITLTASTISDTEEDPANASVSLTMETDGTVSTTGTPSPSLSALMWGTPNTGGLGSGYDVRLDTISGTLSSGSADTWLNMASARTFTVSQNVVGTKTFSGTLRVRDAGGGSDLASAAITLTAEVT